MYSKNITSAEIGLISMIGLSTSTLTQPFWGRLADRFPRRVLLISLSTFLAFTYVLTILASNLYHFIILSTMTYAFTMAVDSTSATHAAHLTESTEVGGGLGRWRISVSLGWAIATLFSGLLTDIFGFPSIFLMSAAITLFSAFFFKSVGEDGKSHESKKTRISGASILRQKSLLVLYISIFLIWIAHAPIPLFLSLYLYQPPFNTPKTLISIAFSLGAIAEIPAMLYFGFLSDKIGRKLLLSVCLFAYPVRLFLTAMFNDPISVLFVQLLSGLTFGGLYVVSIAYISDVVPNKMRGTAVGFYGMAMNLGLILGSSIGGSIIDYLGFKMMYELMALSSIIPALLFIIAGKETLLTPEMRRTHRLKKF